MADGLPRLRVPRVDGAVVEADSGGGPRWQPARGQPATLAGVTWARAATLGPLVLADGSAAARQATTVRVGWDPAMLYVRFECADRDAWGTLTRRNDPIYSEEAVEVFLAPGAGDPRRYFELEVSPLGTLFAARVHNPTARRADLVADTSWDCAGLEWQAEPTGHGQDWRAALAIPWAGLLDRGAAAGGEPQTVQRGAAGPPPAAPPPRLWRANFYRIERPRDGAAELSCWSPTLTDPPDFHRPARFGLLEIG